MKRLQQTFERCRQQNRAALVGYMCAGHPSERLTLPVLDEMVASGVDIVEIGVPFSDPMADGPVIQRASEQAIGNGMDLQGVLDIAKQFRDIHPDVPVVLMGYLNPLVRLGTQRFIKTATASGIDGVLLVDLPVEEGQQLRDSLLQADIAPIMLVAPTTGASRVARVVGSAAGFVYFISVKGITGSGRLDVTDVQSRVEQLKNGTGLPVAVGFGVSTPEQAAALAQVADGVVVGSALVSAIDNATTESVARAAVRTTMKPLANALGKVH